MAHVWVCDLLEGHMEESPKDWCEYCRANGTCKLRSSDGMPCDAVEYRPVVPAKWIPQDGVVCCSSCGWTQKDRTMFCTCGATMDIWDIRFIKIRGIQ